MKRNVNIALLAILVLFTAVPAAQAQSNQDQPDIVDARLEGYNQNVTLNGGTALMWILLIFLSAICVVGLFKDAKRSHLD